MHVGKSPFHAGNVSLIMNTSTGLISPQFHVVFDDNFTTLSSIRKGTEPPNWNHLRRHSFEYSATSDFLKTSQWSQEPDPEAPLAPNLLGFGVQDPATIATPPCVLPSMNKIAPPPAPATLDEPSSPLPQLVGFNDAPDFPLIAGFDLPDGHSQNHTSLSSPNFDFTFDSNPFVDLQLDMEHLNIDPPSAPATSSPLQHHFPCHSCFDVQDDDPSSSLDPSVYTMPSGVPSSGGETPASSDATSEINPPWMKDIESRSDLSWNP